MTDRRRFITAFGSVAAASSLPAQAAQRRPQADATHFGLRPGAADDQSKAFQNAVDQTTARGAALLLPPGRYRCAGLNLPAGAVLGALGGAVQLILARPETMIASDHADRISLTGLAFDGNGQAAPGSKALLSLRDGRDVRINACTISNTSGNGLALERVAGAVTETTIRGASGVGLFSLDARGLVIAGNAVSGCGNGGIHVWQSAKHDDGTIIADNRIEDIAARDGGSGQNGNAINVYRAANVIVRGNRIRNAAFSAVRGNAAANIQVVGNTCATIGEVAIYSEFDFEGAAISANVIDGAAVGVSVTNFDHGGRLAVVQGNVIRNLHDKRPAGTDPGDAAGVGIGVEADTAVTGNVIERAPSTGILVGWGKFLRDVTVSGNVIREAGIGIGVSVSAGAGRAALTGNMIANARQGAIVGMDYRRIAIADMLADPAAAPQIALAGNKIR